MGVLREFGASVLTLPLLVFIPENVMMRRLFDRLYNGLCVDDVFHVRCYTAGTVQRLDLFDPIFWRDLWGRPREVAERSLDCPADQPRRLFLVIFVVLRVSSLQQDREEEGRRGGG